MLETEPRASIKLDKCDTSELSFTPNPWAAFKEKMFIWLTILKVQGHGTSIGSALVRTLWGMASQSHMGESNHMRIENQRGCGGAGWFLYNNHLVRTNCGSLRSYSAFSKGRPQQLKDLPLDPAS